MIVQLAALVLTNALLKQSPKAIFMLLTVTFAPIVARAQMCARLRQSTLNNIELCSFKNPAPKTFGAGFFYFSKFLFVFNLNNSCGLNIC